MSERVASGELGRGAFAAEAFTFSGCVVLGLLAFEAVDDPGRALGVGLACLLIAAFGAVLAIDGRADTHDGAVRRLVRRLGATAAFAFVVAAIVSQL